MRDDMCTTCLEVSLVPGGLLLDDVDRDVRTVLGHLPRGAQPSAQVRGEAPQDGGTGDGRRRCE